MNPPNNPLGIELQRVLPTDLQVKGVKRTDEQRAASRTQSFWGGHYPASQSRTICPHCDRTPGRHHHHKCPRSRPNVGRVREAEANPL